MSLQSIESENPRISTFENEEGKFFRSFLISTKDNDAEWKIDRKTGHDKVKSFIGKDFAIIPHLIQKPISQGGGGHWKGTREEILKAYQDNSHGKIARLVGPFYFKDSPDDYWYDQITKLSNSRSASVLHSEGQKTWNGYDVSPHIFVNKGKNEVWEDWEGAGVNLVIRGAFGPQAIITKFCDGSETKCFKDLTGSSPNLCDESLAKLITSHLSKFASTPHSMPDQQQVAKPENEVIQGIPTTIKDKTNPTTDPQKGLIDAPKITETVSISKEELDRLKERADAVTEMENERKQEILSGLFSVFDDEKERDKEIKDYAKLDMKTVKMLKLYTEKLTPRIQEKLKTQLKAEAKEEEKEDEENGGDKDAKKAKAKEKKEERSGSSTSHLDKEPHRPKFTSPGYEDNNKNEETREASVPEVRNQVWLLREKFLRGELRP